MARIVFLSCVLLCFIACQKNNPNNAAAAGSFFVSVDTATGAVLQGSSADTFLIHLKDPASVAAVPVVLHVPAGGRPDQGTRLNDSIWLDTVDISGNAVPMVNVTVNGKTGAYGIAYEFMINDYWTNALGRLEPESFFFTGDTMYVGSEAGLYYSTDEGVNFTNVPALAATVANYRMGDQVNGVYASGNTIYATVPGAIYTSHDGGISFAEKDFTVYSPTVITTSYIQGLLVQHDTVYLGTDKGLYVSTDGATTYRQDTVGLPQFAVVTGMWVQGSTILMSTWQGLAVSTNWGSSFTMRTSGLGTILGGNDIHTTCLAVEGGIIYIGTSGSGLSISKDNGMTFSTVGMPNGMGDNQVQAVAVSGNLVCVATVNGLSISRDGGASFVNLSTASGLANYWTRAVAIHGSKIYVGAVHSTGNPAVAGGLTVVTLR